MLSESTEEEDEPIRIDDSIDLDEESCEIIDLTTPFHMRKKTPVRRKRLDSSKRASSSTANEVILLESSPLVTGSSRSNNKRVVNTEDDDEYVSALLIYGRLRRLLVLL